MENEPRYGFLSEDKEAIAQALEVVRRKVCIYNPGPFTGDWTKDPLCDCKYGLSIDKVVAGEQSPSLANEQTGCPELRSVIYMLLHSEE